MKEHEHRYLAKVKDTCRQREDCYFEGVQA